MRKLKTILVLFPVFLSLAACGNKSERDKQARFDSYRIAQAPAAFSETRKAGSGEQNFLAYEHSITLEVDETGLRPLYDRIIDTCRSDKVITCTVLDASLSSAQYLSAEIRLRAKSEGTKKLIGLASDGARVLRQSTHVEDLAKPIIEGDKRLAMLEDYRKRLLELQAKPGNNADALIKIAEKIASIQSDLEHAAGEKAFMMDRVNLETLNISLSARGSRSFWAPIADSLREFPSNFSTGISAAIVAIAYAVPWAILALIAFFAIRFSWRRLRKR